MATAEARLSAAAGIAADVRGLGAGDCVQRTRQASWRAMYMVDIAWLIHRLGQYFSLESALIQPKV